MQVHDACRRDDKGTLRASARPAGVCDPSGHYPREPRRAPSDRPGGAAAARP